MKSPFPVKPAATVSGISFFSSAQFCELLSTANSLKLAAQIHAQLVTRSYICSPILFNKLLALYSKCGKISHSISLFSASNSRTQFDNTKNVFTYTSIITRLSHCNLPAKALSFFNEMRERNIYPNHFTFSAILPACRDLIAGKQMHSLICRHGFLPDVFVSSALVDMYANSGEISCARRLFDEMPDRNLVSWNSIIVGFLRNGYYQSSISFFSGLLEDAGVSPDEVSCSSVLIACASLCGVTIGRQVHGIVVKHGLDFLAYVKNSLMDMYCKCGVLDDAKYLFRTIEDRDVVTWNVMVKAFVQNGEFEEACNQFWLMRHEGVSPDEVSLSTALHAAANAATLAQGSLIHAHIIKAGFGSNAHVSSALISMYAKCGSLFDARQAFSECKDHNVVTWTAMISALQQHGCGREVIKSFDGMLAMGIEPDYTTFVSVLSACAHTGHVDHGFHYFNMMSSRCEINPGPEHYASMVDLLGRAGRLEDAKKFVEEMPIEADACVWGALLAACREHGNLDMAKHVAGKLLQIEPRNHGNYMLLYDMYASGARHQEANEVRRAMECNMAKKEPGCSWFDMRNTAPCP